MNISAKRKWRSSEEIALEYLEELGYKILDRNYKIKIEGVEVGEVDAIVENENGEKYAVEIKAGNIDVNGIRQAYVNAQLLGYKPLIVAKGYSDESAEKLAEELGVKIYLLSDRFIVDAEELETIVYSSIKRTLQEILDTLTQAPIPAPEERDFLEKLVESRTIKELAEKTRGDINEVARMIRRLQNRGILSRKTRNYTEIRFQAQLIILRERFRRFLEEASKLIGGQE
jgi:predicted RecB family endonuclease